jgi:guanylate kinase
LSRNTDREIFDAQQHMAAYRPNAEILRNIGKKVFVAVIGPPGAGKSTTLDKVDELDLDFGRTGTITSRAPEERDNKELCHYISEKEAIERIRSREFVNYIVHPTTHKIYATDLEMYSHTYNTLETLPGAVDYFRSLGFKAMHALYLVTDPSDWQTWFNERYNEESPERTKRLLEAEASLRWSLGQDSDKLTYVYNLSGHQEDTARRIIDIVKYDQHSDTDYKPYVEQMLQLAKGMK